jgi:magnesium chelatase family protein
VTKYQKRISGRLLDRIDIYIELPRVEHEKLSEHRLAEGSESIRARAQVARDLQLKRFSKIESSSIVCNEDMDIGEIRQFCKLPEDGKRPMRAAMSNSIYLRELI